MKTKSPDETRRRLIIKLKRQSRNPVVVFGELFTRIYKLLVAIV